MLKEKVFWQTARWSISSQVQKTFFRLKMVDNQCKFSYTDKNTLFWTKWRIHNTSLTILSTSNSQFKNYVSDGTHCNSLDTFKNVSIECNDDCRIPIILQFYRQTNKKAILYISLLVLSKCLSCLYGNAWSLAKVGINSFQKNINKKLYLFQTDVTVITKT